MIFPHPVLVRDTRAQSGKGNCYPWVLLHHAVGLLHLLRLEKRVAVVRDPNTGLQRSASERVACAVTAHLDIHPVHRAAAGRGIGGGGDLDTCTVGQRLLQGAHQRNSVTGTCYICCDGEEHQRNSKE